MRNRSLKSFQVFFACLYLWTGLAAVWHAPHFSRARTGIDVDRHAHHEAAFGDECALCSANTAPQAVTPVLSLPRLPESGWSVERYRPDGREATRLNAARPRGPPVHFA